MNAPTPILTADLIARAIVAAAKVYGLSPISAATARSGLPRRPLTSAVVGAARATGASERRLIAILGLGSCSASEAKRRQDETFTRAVTAAERAVQAALRMQAPVAQRAAALVPPAAPPSPQRLATVRLLNTERRAVVGAVAARPLAPAVLPDVPGSLRARILSVLKDAASTAPSLAILTDAKELAVSEALQCLLREGAVEARPIPPQGARYREWAVTQGIGA